MGVVGLTQADDPDNLPIVPSRETVMGSIENGLELREVFARLREIGGPTLAEGQTACCYALSRNHPLLQALAWFLRFCNKRNS